MDLTRYPFDAQTCTIKIVSYSALKWEIYEQNYDESLAESLAFSTEWHLTDVSTRFFSLKGEMHPEVVLLLRRKTTFYTVCLVLPMVLTSYMNALVFLVPLQSGEKISFLVTIFVSTSVFITFFKDVMPRGLDSVPATMKLLIGVIVQSLVVLVATLFVMWRFHAEQATADVVPSTSSSRSDGKMIVREDVMGDAEDARPAGNKEANLLGGDGEGGITQVVKKVAAMTESSKEQGPEMGGTTSLPERRYYLTAQCLDRIFFFFATVANTIFLLLVFFE